MVLINNKGRCSGCSCCYNICPTKAIEMKEDKEGFVYPVIDEKKCIKCNLCTKTCPYINELEIKNYTRPKVYASWSLDKDNKIKSSSGGCFFEIAKYIISNGGEVVGAGYDDKLNVVHVAASNQENLKKLRGSKYVQSKVNDIYIKVKESLEENKLVLFVGTPCQVAGLTAFLRQKEYQNLYTVDLICHGVPSPKVYRKYIDELSKKYNSKPTYVSFRDKTKGWKKFSFKVEFENKKIYRKTLNTDAFMRGFLQNVYLRPSCYECEFSKLPRVSDITLGDFWGIKNYSKNLDDNTGTSQLIINSKKGEKIINKISDNMFIEENNLEFGIKVNPCLVGSVSKNPQRDDFFKELENATFDELSKKYFAKRSIIKRVVNKGKYIINKK